jgi:hypothetical protein
MMRNQLPSWTYGEIDLYLSPAISMCCSYCLYYILSSSQNKCKIFSCFRVTLPKACLLYILSFCVITKKANSPALVVKFYVTYSVNLINLYFSGLFVWQDCFKGHRLVMLLFWFIEQQGMPSSIWDYYYYFFLGGGGSGLSIVFWYTGHEHRHNKCLIMATCRFCILYSALEHQRKLCPTEIGCQ